MQQLVIGNVIFTIYNDNTVGVEVGGPDNVIDIEDIQVITDLSTRLKHRAEREAKLSRTQPAS